MGPKHHAVCALQTFITVGAEVLDSPATDEPGDYSLPHESSGVQLASPGLSCTTQPSPLTPAVLIQPPIMCRCCPGGCGRGVLCQVPAPQARHRLEHAAAQQEARGRPAGQWLGGRLRRVMMAGVLQWCCVLMPTKGSLGCIPNIVDNIHDAVT